MKNSKMQSPYSDFFKNGEQKKKHQTLYKPTKNGYMAYSEWKNEIVNYISNFSTKEELEDFKHYCIIMAQETNVIYNTFLPFILAMVPLFLSSPLTLLFNTITDGNICITLICLLFTTVMIILLEMKILKSVIKISKPHYFYNDIIQIIENYESEKF